MSKSLKNKKNKKIIKKNQFAAKPHFYLQKNPVSHMSQTMTTINPWPAISDIWLGARTVPVLSVAKEVAAPARSPAGRGAPEHRQVDAD